MDLKTRQRLGSVVLVIIIGSIYLFRAYIPIEYPFWKRYHPNADLRSGATIVEWDDGVGGRGIYFLTPKATVRELLDAAGVADQSGITAADRQGLLRSGMYVRIDEGQSGNPVIRYGRMANATRFALDMTMGVNRATLHDLMLVPGIGQKTAEAIIETRQGMGGFRSMEDLLAVRGIGLKKLETFKKYFYIDTGR